MKISYVYVSNRPGSIDLLADCLANQERNDETPEWELVAIDGHPGRVERGQAAAYLKARGVPVRHYGLPKMRTFSWAPTGYVNAMNTGLIYCSGTHVVFLHDYVWIPPVSTTLWKRAFDQSPRSLISGVGIVYACRPPNIDAGARKEGESDEAFAARIYDSDIRSWTDIDLLRDWDAKDPWVPEQFGLQYWGGPIEFFEGCNGIDERADFCHGWADSCVQAQAALHNYAAKVHRLMVCHRVDHEAWDAGLVQGAYKNSNVPIVPDRPVWTGWSANPYRLADERRVQLERIK